MRGLGDVATWPRSFNRGLFVEAKSSPSDDRLGCLPTPIAAAHDDAGARLASVVAGRVSVAIVSPDCSCREHSRSLD